MTDPDAAAAPSRLLLRVLAGLAVVLLVVAVVLALRVGDDQGAQASRAQSDRAEVLGVARQQAANLTSLSSEDFEGDLSRIQALSTGAFKKDLDSTLATLRQTLSASTFEQSSVLIDSGVSELDGDRASVLLALDQTVRSGERSRTDALRLQLDLLRTDGTWLVDNVIYQPSTVSADAPLPTSAPTATPSPAASPR